MAQNYRSYLLRVWKASDDGRSLWRASLEDPRTGERLGFASLALLFAFLEDQTERVATFNPRRPADESNR